MADKKLHRIEARFKDDGGGGGHTLKINDEPWLTPEGGPYHGITEVNVNLKASEPTRICVRMEMQECDIDAEGIVRINALVMDEDQAREVYETLKEKFEPES